MNWDLTQFDGKDVVFVGAGKGRAMQGVKEFLEAHASYKSFAGVDKQPGEDPLDFLKDYDGTNTVFIKNEGIPGTDMPVPYVTALQLFFALVPETGATTVGVTGTKGKSTTTSLTAHILNSVGKDVVLAGNIGVSPLTALDKATAETIFVLELSSYQLSDLSVSPHISACLNLYNDHTDWHGSMSDYWEAKHNIMRFAGTDDVFIYNPSFPELTDWADHATCKCIPIDPSQELDLSGSKLFGDHNRLNALVAREIVRQFGVGDDELAAALQTYEPLRHRMQFVATIADKTYIDDAIGMTPESTSASLQAISEKFGTVGCMLLGGQDRGYDFTDLFAEIASLGVPNLVLFPDTVDTMKATFPAGYTPTVYETSNMAEAVAWASQQAAPNSVILLSTAAPSYSVWKDFEDKGDQFQAAVSQLS